MKKLIFIFFLLLGTRLTAQVNLVPNNSFEQFDSCPDFSGQINRVFKWNSPTNSTPDILTGNFCNVYLNSNCIDLPNNPLVGYQNARSGFSTAGLVMYSNSPNGNGSNREYLQIKLSSKLKINSLYCVSYYVNLSHNLSKYIIQDFGGYFSNDSIYVFGALPNYPTLQYPSFINNNTFIDDTTNWVEISGYYTATGGEEYFLIGNFTSQESVDTLLYNQNSNTYVAYYLIDDVFVIECDSLVESNEYFAEQFDIYPNPAQDFVSIEIPKNYNQAQLNIYNLTGQLIAQKIVTQPNQQIPITDLDNGMYIFVIQNGDKVIGRQRVVVAR
jgi:hypothetical protein